MSDPLPLRALSNLCALNLLRHRELELRVELAAQATCLAEAQRIVRETTSDASPAFDINAPFATGVAL